MRDLCDKVGALLVERSLDGFGLADWKWSIAGENVECVLLTDFRLGILEFRLKQAKLLELNLELFRGLLVLGVVVGHVVNAICNCSL